MIKVLYSFVIRFDQAFVPGVDLPVQQIAHVQHEVTPTPWWTEILLLIDEVVRKLCTKALIGAWALLRIRLFDAFWIRVLVSLEI